MATFGTHLFARTRHVRDLVIPARTCQPWLADSCMVAASCDLADSCTGVVCSVASWDLADSCPGWWLSLEPPGTHLLSRTYRAPGSGRFLPGCLNHVLADPAWLGGCDLADSCAVARRFEILAQPCRPCLVHCQRGAWFLPRPPASTICLVCVVALGHAIRAM